MGRWGVVLLGGALGALAALAVDYMFGPAPGATYDAAYQSRLDYALAEGRRAAATREEELLAQYKGLQVRKGSPAQPAGDAPPPAADNQAAKSSK